MFIQTEVTPNPATLKFLPGKVVMGQGTAEFRTEEEATGRSPLASSLFKVPGVSGVFFGYDFITITNEDQDWAHIKPAILGTIMEHFTAGLPVMSAGESAPVHGEEFFDEGDETIVATVKELLETRVRPAVAQDGGDITFRGYRDGTVYLNMRGACAGCPSSTATLQYGIQNLLRHFIPEVKEVEAVAA